MKILKVIVDYFPSSARWCELNHGWGCGEEADTLFCEALGKDIHMTRNDYFNSRCPDCPLALEHDNKQIAESVM
jgi:hypothetical protein